MGNTFDYIPDLNTPQEASKEYSRNAEAVFSHVYKMWDITTSHKRQVPSEGCCLQEMFKERTLPKVCRSKTTSESTINQIEEDGTFLAQTSH